MKVYVWRHNKTYHSHSMINEPCVQNHFYLDALAIVAAEVWKKPCQSWRNRMPVGGSKTCVRLLPGYMI